MEKTFEIGKKKFVLDQDKAEEAFAAKAVINGRQTMAFNLLPLKYQWAYDIYRDMKANHWEPEDITMSKHRATLYFLGKFEPPEAAPPQKFWAF